MDWRDDLRAKIETFRAPGETDTSLAGRGGIGPKALYDWLNGRRRPRDSTWERVTKRWRETMRIADPLSVGTSVVGTDASRRQNDANSVQVAHKSTGVPSGSVQAQIEPFPVTAPVSTPGGPPQEGITMNEWVEKAKGFIVSLPDALQPEAMDVLEEWRRRKRIRHVQPQPAAGRAVQRRRG